jgi:hypothetical protein
MVVRIRLKDCKYTWTAVTFDNWIKEQRRQLEEVGIRMGTAEITDKLVRDVLIPNEVNFTPPKMIMKNDILKNRNKVIPL